MSWFKKSEPPGAPPIEDAMTAIRKAAMKSIPQGMTTVEHKKQGERKAREAAGDGRGHRATGRVTQLNLKTKPEAARTFRAEAKRRGLKQAELFEVMLAEYVGKNF